MNELTSIITKDIRNKYQVEMKKMEIKLENSKKAYKSLEDEFRIRLNNEQQKTLDIQLNFDNSVEQYKELEKVFV